MQVLTYFASDYGNLLANFGIEGETFEFIDGTPFLIDELHEFRSEDYYGFRDEWGMGTFWMLRNPNFLNSLGVFPTGRHGEVVEFTRQFNHARLEFDTLEPTEGQLQRDLENIDLARSQAIVALLTAPDEATATQIWQDFLDSRANFSFDAITEYRNNRLDENRARLGMN